MSDSTRQWSGDARTHCPVNRTFVTNASSYSFQAIGVTFGAAGGDEAAADEDAAACAGDFAFVAAAAAGGGFATN
jgi:hypothetical protein